MTKDEAFEPRIDALAKWLNTLNKPIGINTIPEAFKAGWEACEAQSIKKESLEAVMDGLVSEMKDSEQYASEI